MKLLCTICARSGSKGVKNKNLKKINGIELVVRAIRQAKSIKQIEDIIISTDSDKIEKLAKKNGAISIGLRMKSLSGDRVPKIKVIRDALLRTEKKLNKKYDFIIDLDVSSPLRHLSDIKKAIKIFNQNNSDNLLTVCSARKNPYFNMLEYSKNGLIRKVKILKKVISSRQEAPKVYEMNASFYIWKRKILFSNKPFYRKKTTLFEMPFERSLDIDSNIDFKIVKYLLNDK